MGRWQCVDRIIFKSKETEVENLCKTLKNTQENQKKKKNETEESEERKRAEKKQNLAYENCNHERRAKLMHWISGSMQRIEKRENEKKKEIFNNENGKLFFKKPNYCCASSIECKKLNSDGMKRKRDIF